jgi:hypothetical protein
MAGQFPICVVWSREERNEAIAFGDGVAVKSNHDDQVGMARDNPADEWAAAGLLLPLLVYQCMDAWLK